MEIQLTRTKTITIGGGPRAPKNKKGRRPLTDLVGVDLFSGDARGCPAVRLALHKGELELRAVGFIPPPADPLPDSWEAAAKSCSWELPAPFQANHAAFSVTSPDQFLVQTTKEAFRADFEQGCHRNEPTASGVRPKLGIIRPGTASSTPAPAPAAPKTEIEPGIPVSNGGTRFIMKPMDKADGFVMEAGLPEYQVLWLSRLLPEGRRPTAVSIQPRPAALSACLLRQPRFLSNGGSCLAVFVGADDVRIVGFRDGDLVLWRTCHGVPGWNALRRRLQDGLGLDAELVENALEDRLIDPRPVLEPLILPVIDELAVSRDYLASTFGLEKTEAFLVGIPAGVSLWQEIAAERTRLELTVPEAFDGLPHADRLFCEDTSLLSGPGTRVFLGALGAALAVLGEEAAK